MRIIKLLLPYFLTLAVATAGMEYPNGEADYHSASIAAINDQDFSIVAWVNGNDSALDKEFVLSISDASSVGRLSLEREHAAEISAWTKDGAGNSKTLTTTFVAADVWEHYVAVFGWSGSSYDYRAIYLNNAGGTTNTVSRTPLTLDTTSIGVGFMDGSIFRGLYDAKVAHAAIYGSRIDSTVRESLKNGLSPLQVGQGLLNYWPMGGDPGIIRDVVGELDLVETGSVIASEGPPISRQLGGG